MKITIEAEPKEIADLTTAMQSRHISENLNSKEFSDAFNSALCQLFRSTLENSPHESEY